MVQDQINKQKNNDTPDAPAGCYYLQGNKQACNCEGIYSFFADSRRKLKSKTGHFEKFLTLLQNFTEPKLQGALFSTQYKSDQPKPQQSNS